MSGLRGTVPRTEARSAAAAACGAVDDTEEGLDASGWVGIFAIAWVVLILMDLLNS